MVSYIKNSVAAAAILLCLSTAQAGIVTINFEQPVSTPTAPFAPLFTHGDEFYQSGFWLDTLSNSASARPGDLVGALVDGTDVTNTCFTLICPTNNPTTFFTGLDDGLISMGRRDGLNFTVDGFDAAFVGDRTGLNTSVPGRIVFQGVRASDGGQQSFAFNLTVNGQFAAFAPSAVSLLRTTAWRQMFIFGQTCSTAGSCTSFDSDRAQFALDNLRLNVIPEPTSLALVAVAVAGLGFARRRQA